MLVFRTGSEPEHRVAIMVHHIVSILPKGEGFTYIATSDGQNFMVDGAFEIVKEKIEMEQKEKIRTEQRHRAPWE